MLTIQVLGSGCANCQKIEQMAIKVVAALGVQATLLKVTDTREILSFHILATPGLVINHQVVCSGRVPSEAEVTTWVTAALG